MKKLSFSIPAGLIALTFLLPACASGPTMVGPAQAQNAKGITTTRLVVKGKNMPAPVGGQVALMNGGLLKKVLKGYGGSTEMTNMRTIITQIRNTNASSRGNVPGMTGLGGVFGHAFLNMAWDAVKPNGHFNQNGARVVISVSGQITDYAYDPTDGSGKLEVYTYFKRQLVTPGTTVSLPMDETFKWQIKIKPGGYKVIGRNQCPGKYFCDVIDFSQDMKDRADSLGFMHKLWAGDGNEIVIERLWHKSSLPGSTLDEKFATGPEYARLFQTTADSCIDMMFVDAPPQNYGQLTGPPMYCLGRCKDPLIINTGM